MIGAYDDDEIKALVLRELGNIAPEIDPSANRSGESICANRSTSIR